MAKAIPIEGPATRMVVNRDKLDVLCQKRGLTNLVMVKDYAKSNGHSLSLGTLYKIVGNQNYQKESLETLARVLSVDITAFVEFHPVSD